MPAQTDARMVVGNRVLTCCATLVTSLAECRRLYDGNAREIVVIGTMEEVITQPPIAPPYSSETLSIKQEWLMTKESPLVNMAPPLSPAELLFNVQFLNLSL